VNRKVLPLVALAFSGLALADDSVDRVKLIGAWQPQDKSGAAWILQSEEQGLHLTQMQGDQKLADFECNTSGRECEAKGAGKGLKVSMWYSGPKLVVMETRGSEVMKYRFHSLEGDKMEVEVIPIVPDGKPQTLTLTRQAQTTAANQ
jgi:hypothetical protein